MTDDLGPKPEPQIEPGEPNPGGADALDGGDLITARSLFADLTREQPRWRDFVRAAARWPDGETFLPLLAGDIDRA